jgi:hypothetical protein
MKFGIIKSKIDKILLESFSNKNEFKSELKNFQNTILENKNLTKLFWIYDELKNKSNIDSTIVNDYVNETINQYKNIVSKINPKKLRKLELWVEGVDVENEYTDIDNLFSDSVLTIEQKINSRKKITESLKRKVKKEKESINLPISTMVNIANKTIKNYVQQLDENTKGKLLRFLSSDVTEMESKYKVVKESVLNKLSNIKQNSEEEVVTKIDETISKITNEKFDKLNLFRLEELDNSI